MEATESYSRNDLLEAWLEHERSCDSHPDMADHCYRRRGRCAAHSSVRQDNRIHPPWGILLGGRHTPERIEVEERHAPAIEAAVTRVRIAHRGILFELMERIWDIGEDATVTPEAVIENGCDPGAPVPGFDLCWQEPTMHWTSDEPVRDGELRVWLDDLLNDRAAPDGWVR